MTLADYQTGIAAAECILLAVGMLLFWLTPNPPRRPPRD